MPTLSKTDAVEKLVAGVQTATPNELREIYAELFPERPVAKPPTVPAVVQHIRGGLEAEEIVDLWNVVFPADRNVRYDEEDGTIHYNEEAVGYAEAD